MLFISADWGPLARWGGEEEIDWKSELETTFLLFLGKFEHRIGGEKEANDSRGERICPRRYLWLNVSVCKSSVTAEAVLMRLSSLRMFWWGWPLLFPPSLYEHWGIIKVNKWHWQHSTTEFSTFCPSQVASNHMSVGLFLFLFFLSFALSSSLLLVSSSLLVPAHSLLPQIYAPFRQWCKWTHNTPVTIIDSGKQMMKPGDILFSVSVHLLWCK